LSQSWTGPFTTTLQRRMGAAGKHAYRTISGCNFPGVLSLPAASQRAAADRSGSKTSAREVDRLPRKELSVDNTRVGRVASKHASTQAPGTVACERKSDRTRSDLR